MYVKCILEIIKLYENNNYLANKTANKIRMILKT